MDFIQLKDLTRNKTNKEQTEILHSSKNYGQPKKNKKIGEQYRYHLQ